MWAKRGAGRLLPQIEQFGWPVLFRDPHGVVWALWQNKTRRWAYRARWTGEGFGETQECRGPFNAPRLPVNAEKLAPHDAEDVGLLFHAAAAGGENRVLFDRLRIPSLSTADEREVLFLDGLEVAQTSGVERILNEMEKPIRQPSLSPGEGSRVVLNPSVTKRGDTWVMGYTSAFESGEGGSGQGWSVSADGFRFRTVDQLPDGLPEAERFPSRPLDYWRGSEKTRPRPHYPNPDANDPAKKFLRLGFSTDARGSYWLEHSPDGRQWTRGPALTAPEAMRERAQPGFYDAEDPERPIRTYSRVYTETGRSWGVIWTRDLTHWSGLEHLLDPDDPYGKEPEMDRIGTTGKDYTMRGQIFLDAVAGKNEDEIYAAIVRHAEGLYFCFYWPGQQGRPLADVGIAVSRDGFNYSRVKNGERILSLGPPGAWDSGYIFQMSPLFDGETLRVYYRGRTARGHGRLRAQPHRDRRGHDPGERLHLLPPAYHGPARLGDHHPDPLARRRGTEARGESRRPRHPVGGLRRGGSRCRHRTSPRRILRSGLPAARRRRPRRAGGVERRCRTARRTRHPAALPPAGKGSAFLQLRVPVTAARTGPRDARRHRPPHGTAGPAGIDGEVKTEALSPEECEGRGKRPSPLSVNGGCTGLPPCDILR